MFNSKFYNLTSLIFYHLCDFLGFRYSCFYFGRYITFVLYMTRNNVTFFHSIIRFLYTFIHILNITADMYHWITQFNNFARFIPV